MVYPLGILKHHGPPTQIFWTPPLISNPCINVVVTGEKIKATVGLLAFDKQLMTILLLGTSEEHLPIFVMTYQR